MFDITYLTHLFVRVGMGLVSMIPVIMLMFTMVFRMLMPVIR